MGSGLRRVVLVSRDMILWVHLRERVSFFLPFFLFFLFFPSFLRTGALKLAVGWEPRGGGGRSQVVMAKTAVD